MPRRTVLSPRQRSALFDLPTDEPTLARYYTLSDEDIEHIAGRRRPHNKLGFAIQLCAFRYPGRLLVPGEFIQIQTLKYIAGQIGISADELADYAIREETRFEHLSALRELYGFKNFTGRGAQELKRWLFDQAMSARTNLELAKVFVSQCRATKTILPAPSTIERLCADMLVAAERQTEATIAARVDEGLRARLDSLLEDMARSQLTRFAWLRQIEIANNSAKIKTLLEKLDTLKGLEAPKAILDGIPSFQIHKLLQQGGRYFANDLKALAEERRYAIMAACVIEWQANISDTIVESHDRLCGQAFAEAKRCAQNAIDTAKPDLASTLRGFKDLGGSMLEVHEKGRVVDPEIPWHELASLVASATALTNTLAADPLTHLSDTAFNRFRRYVPQMLAALDIRCAPVCEPLMRAIEIIKAKAVKLGLLADFLSPNSKWHRHLKGGDARLWEFAVIFHIKDAFRSGDLWLGHSHQYADLRDTLVPAEAVKACPRLTVALDPNQWLAAKKAELDTNIKALAKHACDGTLPHGTIEGGKLNTERLPADVPGGADQLVLDLYSQIPEVRITDILLEADTDIGFTDAFISMNTGSPCKDKLGLLNVLLAEGLNLGLSKMAEATNTHSYGQLRRIMTWHVVETTVNRALAMVVEAQRNLPMASAWGFGNTASSDGQFFPTTRQGEAMNLINAKYGNEPGLKAYTHVSDQFAPFATQTIPSTVSEAPYILDGLLMNETGLRIKEQYADTGGFTDHVFAVTALLGFLFIPRIRDLSEKRLYLFDSTTVPKELKGLVDHKVRTQTIIDNWPDLLRVVVTLANGEMPPSHLLRKLASYPRQHELAVALREIGKIERTLFITRWLVDSDMQRRAQIGLNKGEAHHALKNAIRIGRQGEIRDRTSDGQRYRVASLNLLAAIIIYWNTKHLGRVVESRRRKGIYDDENLLRHVSPLGWAHILLTGEYRWAKRLPIP